MTVCKKHTPKIFDLESKQLIVTCILNFSAYENELEYIERLLQEDIRNNSAWNQRFFIVTTFLINEGSKESAEQSSTISRPIISGIILDRELQFTFTAIKKVSRNESAWNYLRG